MTPYLSPRSPPEFSATLPPIVLIRIEPGIGRIEEPVPRRGFVDRAGSIDAGLRAEREVARIDVEDRVHLREAEDEAARLGTLPAAQAGTGTARHDRQGPRRGQLHAAGDLVRCPRKNHSAGA